MVLTGKEWSRVSYLEYGRHQGAERLHLWLVRNPLHERGDSRQGLAAHALAGVPEAGVRDLHQGAEVLPHVLACAAHMR